MTALVQRDFRGGSQAKEGIGDWDKSDSIDVGAIRGRSN
jgi:hypothetical protein